MADFAKNSGQVACVSECLHDGGYIAIGVHESHNAAVVAIATCCQDAATRLTDGDGDVGIFKSQSFGGEGIKIWSQVRNFPAETSQGIAVQIIGGEEQDVKFSLGWFDGFCKRGARKCRNRAQPTSFDKIASVHNMVFP